MREKLLQKILIAFENGSQYQMVVTSFLLLILTVNLTCQMTFFCHKIYM